MRISGDGCERLLALEISKNVNVCMCVCVCVYVCVCVSVCVVYVRAVRVFDSMLEKYSLVNFFGKLPENIYFLQSHTGQRDFCLRLSR